MQVGFYMKEELPFSKHMPCSPRATCHYASSLYITNRHLIWRDCTWHDRDQCVHLRGSHEPESLTWLFMHTLGSSEL